MNGRLVFTADDGRHGAEPWAMSLTDAFPAPPPVSPPVSPPVVPPLVPPNPVLVVSTPAVAVAGAPANVALGKVLTPGGTAYRVSITWGDGSSSTGALLAASAQAATAAVSGGTPTRARGRTRPRCGLSRPPPSRC